MLKNDKKLGNPENDIRELLVKNNIEIIEGIEMSTKKFEFRKKKY